MAGYIGNQRSVNLVDIQDGTVSNADLAGSITADKLNVGQLGGRRNLIINGAMQVAQRGTSQTSTSYGSIDRYVLFKDGTASSVSMSQETDDNENYADVDLDRGTSVSGTRYAIINQRIEGTFICGKQVTVSFDAWGSSADECSVDLEYYDGTNYAYATRHQLNYTTTRTTYSFTFTVPSFTAETASSFVALRWINDASSGSSQSINIKLTNVQLELGSVATPFEHRSYGEELALCQRYYEVLRSQQIGGAFSAGNLVFGTQFAVTKRAVPTMTVIAQGTWIGNGTGNAISSTIFTATDPTGYRTDHNSFAGSVTQGYAYFLRSYTHVADAEL